MDRIRNNRLAVIVSILLGVLTLAVYWPVLHHGFASYDDFDYVTENARVQAGLSWDSIIWAFRSIEASNWHPLTWLSHMLDAQFFGLRAAGHHLTSLLLHVANTLLLFFLLKRLTGGLWRSAFVAALFALHPLHVESVAWVAERKDVLSALFFLLTLWMYVRWVEESKVQSLKSKVRGAESEVQGPESKATAGPATHHASRITFHVSRFTSHVSRYYLLSLFCFALGLMSKPMLVTLPFVLWLLDYWPLGRLKAVSLRLNVPLVLEKLPFLALAAASSIVTVLAQSRGGSVSSLGDYALSGRLANAAVSYLRYLGKAVWPTDLAVYYPHPSLNPADRWPAWQIGAAVLALAGISALALLRRKRDPWFAFGWFWYLGMMVPVIGIVQAGSQAMADRYTYLPMIGIFVCAAWGFGACLGGRRAGKVVPALVGALALLACVGLTRRQVNYWQDDFTLFGHALAVNERNAPAHGGLGLAWAREGKYGIARIHCRAAVEADPSDWAAWHTLGDIDILLGKPQEAIQNYKTALRWNPRSAQTWFKLGYVRATLGNLPEAIQDYQEALRQKPEFVPAHNNLGAAWLLLGKREDALGEFTEALRLSPKSPEKHYNLGTTLTDGGKLMEGEAQLTEAVRLKPDYVEALTALAGVLAKEGKASEAAARVGEASRQCANDAQGRFKLGSALMTAGLTNEASAAFAAALRLEPAMPKLLLAAGQSFVQKDQLDDALARFQAVVWIKPDSAEAHERLGLLLANRGKLDEAVFHLKEALRLAPGAETHYNVALALGMRGSLKEAVANYERTLQEKPDSAPALNDLAWIRATAPQAELRDGPAAVRLAQRACELTGSRNARFLGTLAAAYAEAGRFAEAVATAEKARDLALAAGDKAMPDGAEARLDLYRNHQPCRQ
jgi:tetratricopeptide (TPR) repeat protein